MGIELATDVELTVPGYPGVVVLATKPASMREFFMLRRFADMGDFDDDNLDKIESALLAFGDTFLVSWNVDRRGEPVEANGEGLASLPATFQFALLNAWMKEVQGVGEVPAPLVEPSPNGAASPEPSGTTEPSSPNPES